MRLADINRGLVERARERLGDVTLVADELGVGRSTLWRWFRRWATLDRLQLPHVAREVGVFPDEVECALGSIDQNELARRSGCSASSASRRMKEALQLLGRRRVPWGLALTEQPTCPACGGNRPATTCAGNPESV